MHGSSGPEQRLVASTLSRHRHAQPYAAIVLEGGYVEAGDLGCWRVEAGDVVAHGAFEAHLNTVQNGGARVLNLALDEGVDLPAVFRVADVDALIHLVRADPSAAAVHLQPLEMRPVLMRDWPDLLAEAMRTQPDLHLGAWAAKAGLARATVSRGFAAAFGVSPVRYRGEVRALNAWRRIRKGHEPLAAIAHDCGFADQAHLTRATRALTGAAPTFWRRVKTIQDRTVVAA